MKSKHYTPSINILFVLAFVFITNFPAQSQTNQVKKGKVERMKVHGKGLEGNLAGDSPERDVSVYLPPSYQANTKRRYPVVYLLHGFTDNDVETVWL